MRCREKVAFSVFALLVSNACGRHDDKVRPIVEVSVAKLSTLLKENKAYAVDANSKDTRAEYGVVPGARLLSSSNRFDDSELPDDKTKQLVFYCANTECHASDSAAQRAMRVGYTNVAVLRVGIQGWKESGMPTEGAPAS